MLDSKYFAENLEDLKVALGRRGAGADIVSAVQSLSVKRKELIKEVEALKSLRNSASQEIGTLKAKAKTDPTANDLANKKMAEMREVGDKVKVIDESLKEVETKLSDIAMRIPNIPHSEVPTGHSSEENREVRRWGEPKKFDFAPKDHTDLGTALGILDFERAGKISGARFALYLKAGARLERALIQFMLDLHTSEHGYTEVIPPFLVNRDSMTGTGNLPKFEEDLFKTAVADRELFLIPTSEVPLTNIYAQEILDKADLPKHFTAYSPCFRSEAGSYGKDTKGLIRQHQFQKVELVKIVEPESSMQELEAMVKNAEKVLQLLEIPYRVMLLCSGDMGFSSTKTYDIEVWLPAQNTYREISSCSNCSDFQARRAKIRYRKTKESKPEFVHTLNGSGLAVGRTFIAVLENYQDAQGNIQIPKVLTRYLQGAHGFTEKNGQLWIMKA